MGRNCPSGAAFTHVRFQLMLLRIPTGTGGVTYAGGAEVVLDFETASEVDDEILAMVLVVDRALLLDELAELVDVDEATEDIEDEVGAAVTPGQPDGKFEVPPLT